MVHIPINSIELEGNLTIPPKAKAIVIFAHGSGSSRLSPRNNFVAKILQESGFATLLFDLLTLEEDTDYSNRFDINLLANRLAKVTNWISLQPKTKNLNIGFFGASTGSAAALIVAAKLGEKIKAVVSRGGRPDLARNFLSQVTAPTLLIVGGNDYEVIELNKAASELIQTTKQLSIVPGATHLFEEPNALEQVAELAKQWFIKYL